MRQAHERTDVDVDLPARIGDRKLPELTEAREPCVVHQQIDRFVVVGHTGGDPFEVVQRGEIGHEHLDVRGPELVAQRLETIPPARHQNHSYALGHQLSCDLGTDTCRCARDERSFPSSHPVRLSTPHAAVATSLLRRGEHRHRIEHGRHEMDLR